jgi:ATP/ADP translocase/HEAT repeat protein
MENERIYKVLSRLIDVRPGEAYSSLLLFLYFFLITSSAYIIKPVKISLFLEKLTFERLPYAYLLTALLIGFVVTLNSKLLHSMKRHIYISISLVFFTVNLVVFWLLFKEPWRWPSFVYWFWADIFTATSVTQFWILVNDIYHPRQARRLVGFLVSGGLLGGVAGALLATVLAKTMGTENLLLICPALLVLCLLIVNRVAKFLKQKGMGESKESVDRQKKRVGYIRSFRLITENRHLMFLCGLMIAAIVVTTLIDFQFNSVVEQHFTVTIEGQVQVRKDAMTAFLGIFFTLLLVFSYLLHVLLTNRVLKSFGIRVALLIAPVFLLLGSVAIFLVPLGFMVYWAVAVKGADKSLAHSLSQSVRELLYIPVSPEIKYKAKVFIDMFVNKFAKGLGALLLLLFFSVLHLSVKQMSLVVVLFTLIWILFNLQITREYVSIVKKNLKIKWEDADKFVGEQVNIDMTKLVFDTLQSRRKSSVLYAMNLFDLIKKEKLSPELKKIISHKSEEVRAGSLDSLLELDGEALIPEMDDTVNEEQLDTQVKEIMSLDVYQELVKDHIDKISQEKGEKAEVSKMEAAKVLGMMEPSSAIINNLSALLRDESPEVLRYALESAGNLKERAFVPLIVPHLRRPSTTRIASQALVEFGTKIVGTLKDYLGDEEENPEVRRAIPDILARIGSQKAAFFLTLELRRKNKDVEPEIIEALYKMKSRSPDLQFQKPIILTEVVRLIRRSYLILLEIDATKADEKKAYLGAELEKNLARVLKHVFELLTLVYPHEDVMKAYQNITVGTRKAIDYSIELLDNVLKREIMDYLLPLIDDLSFEDRIKKCKKMLKTLDKAADS